MVEWGVTKVVIVSLISSFSLGAFNAVLIVVPLLFIVLQLCSRSRRSGFKDQMYTSSIHKDRLRVKLVIDITNLTQPHLDEEKDVRGHQIKDKGDKVVLNLDTSARTTHANVFNRKDEKSM